MTHNFHSRSFFDGSRIQNPESRIKISKAFTILEMLIATSILAVIMGILFNIFNKVSDAWIYGETTVDRNRNARMTLELMNREMSHAMVTTGTVITAVKFLGTSNEVYFIAPITSTSANISDLAELGYKYDPAKTNVTRYVTDPTSANKTSGKWNITQSFSAPSSLPSSSEFTSENVVAENVFGFNIQYYNSSGTGSDNWDSFSGAGQQGLLPSVVEVSIFIMDSRNAAHIPASDPARSDHFTRYGRTNTVVIHLFQAP